MPTEKKIWPVASCQIVASLSVSPRHVAKYSRTLSAALGKDAERPMRTTIRTSGSAMVT